MLWLLLDEFLSLISQCKLSFVCAHDENGTISSKNAFAMYNLAKRTLVRVFKVSSYNERNFVALSSEHLTMNESPSMEDSK